MAKALHSVLVPLAGKPGEAGRLARITAGDVAPAGSGEMQLDPQIAGLRQSKLYRAGETAQAALRETELVRRIARRLVLTRRTPVPGYLSVADGQDALRGLDEKATSSSAQLGLALALVLHAADHPVRAVFATGALLPGGVDPSVVLPRERVAVHPVEGIPEKLAAVATLAGTKGAAVPGQLFLPATTTDGRATREAYAGEIAALEAAFAAHGHPLTVHAVATLDEAIERLAIRSLAIDRRETWLRRAIAGTVAAGILGAVAHTGWQAWLARPIDLTLASVPVAERGERVTPLRIRHTTTGERQLQPDCRDADRVPLFGVGDRIVVAAEVREPEAAVRQLGGYRFAVLGVSASGGVKEFHDRELRFTADHGKPRVAFEIVASDRVEEVTRVLVLVRRVVGFDRAAIRDEMRRAVDAAPPGERINAATALAARLAPRHVSIDIRTMAGEVSCTDG
jgi:hypothetical protein